MFNNHRPPVTGAFFRKDKAMDFGEQMTLRHRPGHRAWPSPECESDMWWREANGWEHPDPVCGPPSVSSGRGRNYGRWEDYFDNWCDPAHFRRTVIAKIPLEIK